MKMKELTRAEEQIMQILWDLEKGFVKDVLEKFPEPKPAYNTVSTICRILVKKGFLDLTVPIQSPFDESTQKSQATPCDTGLMTC